ncbi:cytochrome c-type biogenesis protein CcmH [Martelella alba]|uniref:Cytochrome c-type biogenesis protein n=2 Tax=Martelella alba TaxID=2590451 RepID=A0ABY2SGA4_9HYPH|nr:cytochrome c-type biogenesis protein CcmH [Martelella alba]
MRLRYLVLLWVMFGSSVYAAAEARQFHSQTQEQQYYRIIRHLRCPQCQNSSIADSDARVAAAMRDKTYQLLQQGWTERRITDYMVARYGYFVTYTPPVNWLTIWLWAGPFVIMAAGGLVIYCRGKRRGRANSPLSADERRRLAHLLHNSGKRHL